MLASVLTRTGLAGRVLLAPSAARLYAVSPELQKKFELIVKEKGPVILEKDNETKLKYYALFKQATVGDVEGCKSCRSRHLLYVIVFLSQRGPACLT